MTVSKRQNIYLALKREFSHYNTIVDIACGNLSDLFNFEDSPFRELIGIDKKFKREPFIYYKHFKGIVYENGLIAKFHDRFKVFEMDFNNYEFIGNDISLIICNKVLHFYEDAKKFEMIQRLYSSLSKDGLLYIKVNHSRHPNNTDPNKTKQIGPKSFQSLNDPTDIRHLVDPIDFIRQLSKDYTILHTHTKTTEKTTELVIKK